MRTTLIACCVSVTLFLAACGSSNDGSPTTPSSPNAAITITANNGSQSFSPNPAQVGGQMISWRNQHGQTHRIVANDGSFDTGDIVAGASSRMVQIPAIGTNYHCSIHPSMIGAIGGSGGAPPPPCTDDAYCE